MITVSVNVVSLIIIKFLRLRYYILYVYETKIKK